VLASILLHSGFTDDGARRAAKVYKENIAFLKSLGEDEPSLEPAPEANVPVDVTVDPQKSESPAPPPTPVSGKMLAQYQIPLGANHAQLIFTGEELVAEDFDALKDYVEIFKRQFERKARRNPTPPPTSFPPWPEPEE
jgi:hypothetical protein